MSDANYTSLAAQRETTWGVLPDPPALKLQRMTGESLSHAKDTIVSEEIRSDRQISDLAEVGSSAEGSFDFELSYLQYQELFEAALFNNIVTIAATGITASAVASTQTLTAAAGTPFANVIPGCFVRLSGFTDPANNGVKLVTSMVDGDTLTLAAGSIATDQAGATVNVTGKHLKNGIVRHSYTFERGILNTEGNRYYQQYRGMMVDQLELAIESKQIVTGTFSFIGRYGEVTSSVMDVTGTAATGTLTFSDQPEADETVTIGSRVYTFKSALTGANQVLIGATVADSRNNLVAAINGAAGAGTTYGNGTVAHAQVSAAAGGAGEVDVTARTLGTAANSLATTDTVADAAWGASTLSGGVDPEAYTPASLGPVLNGTSNVGTLLKDGLTMSEKFKTLSITLANNLRGKDAIGEKGNWDIGVGSCDVSGSISAYFRNNDMLRDFINHTYTGLAMVLTDGDGKSIGIHMPHINFSTGGPQTEGKDTDLMQGMDYQAILSPVYGATIFVSFLD